MTAKNGGQGEAYTPLMLTDISSIDGSRSVEVVGDLLTVRYMTDGYILVLQ